MDIAYRCNRCGKIILSCQILYGNHACGKCGSRRVAPIMQDLTKFGVWYLTKKNSIYGLWNHS